MDSFELIVDAADGQQWRQRPVSVEELLKRVEALPELFRGRGHVGSGVDDRARGSDPVLRVSEFARRSVITKHSGQQELVRFA